MKKIANILLVCMLLLTGCTAEAATVNGTGGTEAKQEAPKSRYVKLFSDNSFNYYMDKDSAKWIRCPNTSDKYIIDVWIKMEQIDDKSITVKTETAQYSYPAKYYLEHYYINPDTAQIQFLCELEVTGRPDNDITQRKYDVHAWEDLIPDSVEDNIYQSVVKIMGKKYKGDNKGIFAGAGNMLEDVFRISI